MKGNDIENTIDLYISDLMNNLKKVQETPRNSFIEEIKDHLLSYVQEKRDKGLSEKQITELIKKEFESANKLAEEYFNMSGPKIFSRKTSIITILLIFGLILMLVFPAYSELITGLLITTLVITNKNKNILAFAVFRKYIHQEFNISRANFACRFYILIIGLLFIVGNFINVQYKEIIMTIFIIMISSLFFFYVKYGIIYSKEENE